jgi:peptidoglycan/LPS O-acetylase OafA/YrhL
VEEQFYLLWPLLLAITWKRRMNPLAVILALMSPGRGCESTIQNLQWTALTGRVEV